MRSGRIDIEGTSYAFLEAGRGPLLLFAHGTFGAKESFIPQMEILADRYRCVSVDLPGHGQSGFNPAGWTVDDLVRAVPELVAALGERRAALAGVSQGGAIFMRAALAYPDLVSALVIICAGAEPPPPPMLQRLRDFAQLLREESDPDLRHQAADLFASAFHAPGFAHINPDAFEAEVSHILNHPRAAMPLIPGVPASYVSVADRLREIACPTLIVWGENDFRPALGKDIAAAIPGAQLLQVPNAGHHVHIDAPAILGDAIKAFLDSHTRP